MKYDELNLQKIREVPIFDVCSMLGITLYGMGKLTKRAKCWYHDDKHPSMHVNKKKNIYKCFVCGKGGDVIRLVQDHDNKTFLETCDWLVNEFHVVLIENTPASKKVNHGDCPNDSSAAEIRGTITRDSCVKNSCNSCNSLSDKNISVNSVCPLDPSLVSKSLSVNSVFCKSVVSAGYLSDSQLRHAASRYRLGRSKDGGVIFWEIDDQQRVHTGKIMYYQSDCHRDKSHNPTELQHCLFGLHLLNSHPDPLMGRGYLNERATGGAVKPPNIGGGLAGVDASFSSFLRAEEKDRSGNNGVAIVESEKTAVIMSELIPEFIWLSCGGLQMFKPELLAPLVNHKVILFPDTDSTGEAYNQWLTVLQQAQRQYAFKYPLRISRLLEDKASPEQKQRKIDLVDFLFEVPQK